MNITTKPTLCLIKELAAAIGPINTVAISADANWVASAGGSSISWHDEKRYRTCKWSLQLYDRSWQKTDLAALNNWKPHGADINSICFTPDGHKLIIGSGASHEQPSISCWDIERSFAKFALEPNQTIFAAITDVENKVFFIAYGGGIIKEYNIDTGILVKEWSTASKNNWCAIYAFALSTDGRYLYGAKDEKFIKIWHTQSGGELPINFQAHSHAVRSLALSPDNSILASGSDQRIRIWNAQTGELIHSFYGHADWVRGLAITPNSRFLISAGDEKIKFWDLATGKKLNTISAHDKPIRSISLSRDGSTLVSGSTDGIVKVWQVNEVSEITGV
jgi:COMPASS component SWD3